MAVITTLMIYPVKSCRGIALHQAMLTDRGFAHDREWLIVRPDGRFVTQREESRLALIEPSLERESLRLSAPGMQTLTIPQNHNGNPIEVVCWRDRCAAFDAGETAAQWLGGFLGKPHRLVRFNSSHRRASDTKWTHGAEALNRFTDGFPWLLISQASLDDLNARLPHRLPMNRFRPNIVIDGLPAYGEDRVDEFANGEVRLRAVKPCTRCIITTTDQATAARDPEEPLKTLKTYRSSRDPAGVLFGQNLILVAGAGRELRVGDQLAVRWK